MHNTNLSLKIIMDDFKFFNNLILCLYLTFPKLYQMKTQTVPRLLLR